MSSLSDATSSEPSKNSEITEPASHFLTNHRLDGNNYLLWSRSIKMLISGQSKMGYLTGTKVAPASTDPRFEAWDTENNQVMTILTRSMTKDISENFMLYDTAKEIWDDAKDLYSKTDNTSEIYEIEAHIQDAKQGDLSVTQFFNQLTKAWQQLDMFEELAWKNADDATLYKSVIEQKRVFKFLMGLNPALDDVRGRVLSTKPLPSLKAIFSIIKHEESRRKLMLKGPSSNSSLEGSALVSLGKTYEQTENPKNHASWNSKQEERQTLV
jgi:hypothetical protein